MTAGEPQNGGHPACHTNHSFDVWGGEQGEAGDQTRRGSPHLKRKAQVQVGDRARTCWAGGSEVKGTGVDAVDRVDGSRDGVIQVEKSGEERVTDSTQVINETEAAAHSLSHYQLYGGRLPGPGAAARSLWKNSNS